MSNEIKEWKENEKKKRENNMYSTYSSPFVFAAICFQALTRMLETKNNTELYNGFYFDSTEFTSITAFELAILSQINYTKYCTVVTAIPQAGLLFTPWVL